MGAVFPCRVDTDGDGIRDGTEIGVTPDEIGEDADPGGGIPDTDSETTTNPLSKDSDRGGISDGREDLNANGRVDAGETDPLKFTPRHMPFLQILLLED